ncbi:hypothetical protein [Streptomyces sp. NPDC047070]|uniref:hypothetical protein n=1 Tax=Streptomyces sp. NPDC047070 TaxID=3154923 RepID=UPI00345137BC
MSEEEEDAVIAEAVIAEALIAEAERAVAEGQMQIDIDRSRAAFAALVKRRTDEGDPPFMGY